MELLARLVSIFVLRTKIEVPSTQPSAATLVRVAVNLSNLSVAKNEPHPFGWGSFLELLSVAVPCVRLADTAATLHTDRGHSFESLLPPLAALLSLPRFSLASPVQKVSVTKNQPSRLG